MIYRNTRPYAINLVNTIENKNYIVEAYSMTPDLPEEFARRYGDILVPLIADSKIVRGSWCGCLVRRSCCLSRLLG